MNKKKSPNFTNISASRTSTQTQNTKKMDDDLRGDEQHVRRRHPPPPPIGSGGGEGAVRRSCRLLPLIEVEAPLPGAPTRGRRRRHRTPLPSPPWWGEKEGAARHCCLTSRCRCAPATRTPRCRHLRASLSSHHHTPLHRQPTQRERNRERGERMRCRLEGIRIWMVRTCRLGSI